MAEQLQQLKKQLQSRELRQTATQTVQTVTLSLKSLRRSVLHPYVQDKVKTCFKPVLLVAIGIYAAGLVLVVPITIIAFIIHLLSLGYVKTSSISGGANSLLYEATTIIPLVSVAILRQFIRKPLDKCFIHMLREVNPSMAAHLESSPRLKQEAKRTQRPLITSYLNQTVLLIGLELGVHVLHKVPYIGPFAHPLLHFLTMSRTVHSTPALALAVVSFVPFFGTPIRTGVRLWRAAHVLGAEMVGDYVAKAVPHSERTAFWKQHGLTVTLFMLPQMALMKIPVLGAAVVFPMAASAAWLVDLLAGRGAGSAPSSVPSAAEGPAPTRPMGDFEPHGTQDEFFGHGGSLRQRPGYGTDNAGQQGYGKGSFPAGGMQQPSAPPMDPALLRPKI